MINRDTSVKQLRHDSNQKREQERVKKIKHPFTCWALINLRFFWCRKTMKKFNVFQCEFFVEFLNPFGVEKMFWGKICGLSTLVVEIREKILSEKMEREKNERDVQIIRLCAHHYYSFNQGGLFISDNRTMIVWT